MSREQEENWIDRILTAAILGLIGWNLYTTFELSKDVAVIKEAWSRPQTEILLLDQRLKTLELTVEDFKRGKNEK